MSKEDIWTLFKQTGNINYYIKYKSMEDDKYEESGNNLHKSNSN